jgi:hypothetical protein
MPSSFSQIRPAGARVAGAVAVVARQACAGGLARSQPSPGMLARAAIRARADRERGSLTLVLAALFTALLALAGLVIDGGAKLDEAQNAAALAQEAARAGAGQVNQQAAHASGRFVVDQAAAVSAARQFLAVAGAHGTVRAAGPTGISVSVTLTEPTTVLSLIGIRTISGSGSATASLITGVTGAGR